MASSTDIQAGRAAISVVLDDDAIQPQLQQLSSRLKTAAAGSLTVDGTKAAGKFREKETAKDYANLAKEAANLGASHLGAIPGVSGLQDVLSAGHPALIAVAAATAGVAAAYKLATVAADWYTSAVKTQLGEIDALSAKAAALGTTVQALREFRAAAKEVGEVEANDFDEALQKLTRRIGEAATGSKDASQAFAKLGLQSSMLANQTPTEAFLNVADAISRIENPAQRAAAANDVFGRGSAKLIPLLQGGRDGIEAATAAYREYAGVITEEQVAAIGAQDKAWGRVQAALEGIAAQAAADLAPALQVAAERVSEILDPGTSTGQSFRMALEVIPPLLAKIIDLSDVMIGTFQLGQAKVMELAALVLNSLALADRAAAALTPGYTASESLQAMAADYQRQLDHLNNEAAGRIAGGLSGQAATDVERARKQAAADAKGGKTAGDAGAMNLAEDGPGEGEQAKGTEDYAKQFEDAMQARGEATQRALDADKQMAEDARQYAADFAAAMEGRAESNKTARDADAAQAEETAAAAADFASAMEDAGEANLRAREADAAADPVAARIAELQKQQAADEIERRAREAVQGPKESVAGTFNSWRLGGQFGTPEQTAREQLEETRRMNRALDRLIDITDRKPELTH